MSSILSSYVAVVFAVLVVVLAAVASFGEDNCRIVPSVLVPDKQKAAAASSSASSHSSPSGSSRDPSDSASCSYQEIAFPEIGSSGDSFASLASASSAYSSDNLSSASERHRLTFASLAGTVMGPGRSLCMHLGDYSSYYFLSNPSRFL